MTKTTKLEKDLRDIPIHPPPLISDSVSAEQNQLQKEKESIKQCLAICAIASEQIRERLQKEKESTEKCLAICIKALEHICQLQSNLSEEFSRDISSTPGVPISSKGATADALQECNDILIKAIREIKLK
jgi:hypothetical protein